MAWKSAPTKGAFKWHATGIQETIARLATFKKRFQTKALRKAGNEASRIVLPVLKNNTPVAKGAYGKGGSLKKSLGRKVVVKNGRMWFGVGPRTKWMKEIAKANRFWRDKQGRIRKAPLAGFKSKPTKEWRPGGARFERPSRRAHLSEKRSKFISRTMVQTRNRADAVMRQVLRDAVAEA